MSYCTLTDLEKLIPEAIIIQLTDDENLGAVNTSRVSEAIAQAGAEIDFYCGGRVTVPFATAPDIIKKMSVDLAIYNLYSRRVEEIPATRADRYKNAIRQLEGIASGKTSIEALTKSTDSENEGANTNLTFEDRIFTKDKLSGF